MIHKCPRCGKEPEHDTTDRNGRWWDIHCCGAAFVDQADWNCYATAMAYALADDWLTEVIDTISRPWGDASIKKIRKHGGVTSLYRIEEQAEEYRNKCLAAMRDAMREE